MKKFFALLLAIMMVMSLAVTASAADSVSVSFTHPKAGHTFVAYQIFDGDLTADHVLSNVVWGSGIQNGDKLIQFLTNDETVIYNSDKTQSVVVKDQFAGATTAAGIAEKITNWTTDGARLDYLAEVIGNGRKVGDTDYTFLAAGTSTQLNAETLKDGLYTYTIENLDPGYYIIIDETAEINGEDYRTKYMLLLTNHTDISTKGDYSTVIKQVKDNQTGIYGESVSQHLNKTLNYKWTVDLDENMEWYDTYYFKFVDTMTKGLKFEGYNNIYFIQNDQSRVYLMENGEWKAGQEALVTKNSQTKDAQGNTVVELEWNDLKKAFPNVDGDHTFVVEYTATVTEDAVYGVAGNPNEVYIIYSNSPSDDGKGQSVPDDAIEFNFQLEVDKVDADNHDKKLEGAEFYLYHMHGTEKMYAVVTDGKIVNWVSDTAAATKLVTDANGAINVAGLTDAVTYFLHEVKAPYGYNLMFTDVSIKITAGHLTTDNVFVPGYVTGSNGKLTYTALQYTVDGHHTTLTAGDEFTHGIVTAQVKNDAGQTLPSTGGMGTTLFYAFGGMMVAVALVMLVTKKRMAADC